MPTYTALYDACVLYPAPLRDLLMELALTDLFRAKWSARIHDEWIRSAVTKRPELTVERLQRTRQLMDMHVRDCLVENFEELIPSLSLPDPDDRHVLAAAIRGRADVIVTYNLKDFPDKELQKYAITAQHPDEFLTHLLDLSPGIVCSAARNHRARLSSYVARRCLSPARERGNLFNNNRRTEDHDETTGSEVQTGPGSSSRLAERKPQRRILQPDLSAILTRLL